MRFAARIVSRVEASDIIEDSGITSKVTLKDLSLEVKIVIS